MDADKKRIYSGGIYSGKHINEILEVVSRKETVLSNAQVAKLMSVNGKITDVIKRLPNA
jgi:hypothetical protein